MAEGRVSCYKRALVFAVTRGHGGQWRASLRRRKPMAAAEPISAQSRHHQPIRVGPKMAERTSQLPLARPPGEADNRKDQ